MDDYYLNRTLCDVLDEMRKGYETRNFAPLLGLIEEAQSMGNRMEAAIAEKKDLLALREEWEALRKNVKNLRNERAQLFMELERAYDEVDDE